MGRARRGQGQEVCQECEEEGLGDSRGQEPWWGGGAAAPEKQELRYTQRRLGEQRKPLASLCPWEHP